MKIFFIYLLLRNTLPANQNKFIKSLIKGDIFDIRMEILPHTIDTEETPAKLLLWFAKIKESDYSFEHNQKKRSGNRHNFWKLILKNKESLGVRIFEFDSFTELKEFLAQYQTGTEIDLFSGENWKDFLSQTKKDEIIYPIQDNLTLNYKDGSFRQTFSNQGFVEKIDVQIKFTQEQDPIISKLSTSYAGLVSIKHRDWKLKNQIWTEQDVSKVQKSIKDLSNESEDEDSQEGNPNSGNNENGSNQSEGNQNEGNQSEGNQNEEDKWSVWYTVAIIVVVALVLILCGGLWVKLKSARKVKKKRIITPKEE